MEVSSLNSAITLTESLTRDDEIGLLIDGETGLPSSSSIAEAAGVKVKVMAETRRYKIPLLLVQLVEGMQSVICATPVSIKLPLSLLLQSKRGEETNSVK